MDAFGAAIKDGETYYKMELGGSVTNHEKLSRASMETFLHLIFSGSPLLQKPNIFRAQFTRLRQPRSKLKQSR